MSIYDFIIALLTMPEHYFAESFILDLLGVALWVEEVFLNLFG